MPPNKVFTRIYCKIFCDEFPDDGFTEGKQATGSEIYSFLTKELVYATDPETDEPIPGDYAIWYLGSNEKFGILQVDDQISEWTFGESSWERVLAFIYILYDKHLITDDQFQHLLSITFEGSMAFDDMYQIPTYLKAKQLRRHWKKPQTTIKSDMQKTIADIHEILISSGWQVVR